MFEHMGFLGSCVTYLSKISVQPHGHGTSFKPLSITCETKMRWEVDKIFYVLQIRFRDVCKYMNLHVNVYVSVHVNVNVSVYASVHVNVNVSVYASVHVNVNVSVYASVHLNEYVSVYASVHLNVYVSVYASVHANVNVSVYASVHAVAYKRRSILTACM